MNSPLPDFRAPSGVERAFNRAFGFAIRLGLGFRYNYLLEVCGRKTGRLYSTPVNLLELDGKKFLIAPRGRTQWVRNAEASGEISLRKRRAHLKFRLRPLSDADKLNVLKAYLERFKSEVQRYFPVPAGSPVEAFKDIAPSYPAFELLAL